MDTSKKNHSLSRHFGKHRLTLKMRIPKTKLIFSMLFLCPLILLGQWVQLGEDIDGEAINDQSGYSISLSADGNTVIIGAPFNDNGGSSSGHIRVFENNANIWQQKGNDINGANISDKFGFSVSISADGNTIAVGAPDSNANGFESGHVRVYQFEETEWIKIGEDIIGETGSDHSGHSVSLSADGNRVAIGAPDNGVEATMGSNFGQVRIYENQGDNWEQIGEDIDGENPEDNSGFAVSLNEDGNIVAIGAPNNTNTIQGAGHVRVYNYDSNNWVQIGEDIDGIALNDKFGGAVSLNNQGNIIAVGARDHSGIGQVSVFENLANAWVQVGDNIDGEGISDEFGVSVSLNASGSILAVGAQFNSDFILDAGHVRLFRNQDSNWLQIDSDIDGEDIEDRSGRSVSLSADGGIVAIGAYLNNGNDSNSGHVRLFSNGNILGIENSDAKDPFTLYPNPVTTQLQIDLNQISSHSTVELFNMEGRLVYSQDHKNTDLITMQMTSFSKGIYILKIQLDETQKTLKVIKQ